MTKKLDRRSKRGRGGRPGSSSGDGDSSLTLIDNSGEVIHIAPAAVTDSLRYMFGRTRMRAGGEFPDRVGVISAVSGEGVTFVARSLALVLSHDAARRVCLVDLNWWSPSSWGAADAFGGIADVVRWSAGLDEVIVPMGNPGLDVLPAGATTVSERPYLANSPALGEALTNLGELYDHVIVDLPAIRATGDALALADASRNLVMVVASGVVPDGEMKSISDDLVGTTVLGAVLNRDTSRVPGIVRRRIPSRV